MFFEFPRFVLIFLVLNCENQRTKEIFGLLISNFISQAQKTKPCLGFFGFLGPGIWKIQKKTRKGLVFHLVLYHKTSKNQTFPRFFLGYWSLDLGKSKLSLVFWDFEASQTKTRTQKSKNPKL